MAETKKRNPFSRLHKMQAIAAEEEKKASSGTENKEPEKVNEPKVTTKKSNPFAKRKSAVKPEDIPTVDGDEDGTPSNPDNDDALIAVANEPEVNEVPVSEKPKRKRASRKKKTEEPAEETAPQEKADEEPASKSEENVREAEETKEVVEVEKKPAKRSKKSSDQSRAEKLLEANCKFLFTSDLSVEEAASMILKSYSSEEYTQFKNDIYQRAAEITIDPDMNPGTIRYKLHSIDALKMELLPLKVNTREFLHGLMQKDYGVVSAYISENSIGSNPEERKRNGFRALANFECGGRNINMLTTMTGVQMRDEFLDAVLGDLENKQRVLITYLGTLKVDSNVAPLAEGY